MLFPEGLIAGRARPDGCEKDSAVFEVPLKFDFATGQTIPMRCYRYHRKGPLTDKRPYRTLFVCDPILGGFLLRGRKGLAFFVRNMSERNSSISRRRASENSSRPKLFWRNLLVTTSHILYQPKLEVIASVATSRFTLALPTPCLVTPLRAIHVAATRLSLDESSVIGEPIRS